MGQIKLWARRRAQQYMDAHLRTKMLLLFSGILLVTILLIGGAYRQIYTAVLGRRVGELSERALSAIGNSMDTLINMENSYSKVILSNSDIQNTLKQPNGLLELSRTRSVNTVLMGQLEINTVASSVYIIDNEGNRYGVDKRGLKPINIFNSDITTLPWYQEISDRRGGYLLVKNGGGIFLDKPKEDFISLVRIINSLDNFRPIGILMLNIPVSSFAQACLVGDYADEINIIVSGSGGDVILEALQGELAAEPYRERLSHSMEKTQNGLVRMGGTEYVFSQIEMKSVPWSITGLMPTQALWDDTSIFAFITVAVLIITSLLLFLGVWVISRYITRPIEKLLKSMASVEQGIFKKVDFPAGNDEIGQLQRHYNSMVERIGILFQKTIQEQKQTRRMELNLLQAQIKPHFLYNTLDSIRSLSLTGDNRRVYYTVTALENYYRTCLSSGKEVITIADEVASVKNYLRVQRIRYRSLFRAIYSIDAELLNVPILKLVLQPLAENSLYHGIKPKGGNGVIHISVQRQGAFICLAVEDNGVGMPQERAEALLNLTGGTHFGLCGTAERLRIFYEGKSSAFITGIPGIGTRIELIVPIGEEEAQNDE